jgi:hypothetical protein
VKDPNPNGFTLLDPVIETLERVTDVMHRSDPVYCKAQHAEPCSDQEWDAALKEAEGVLTDLKAVP